MPTADDEAITGDIIAALGSSPDVHATSVRVHTDHGRVRLEGVVDTLEERTVAEEIATRVEGVRWVENDLVVSANGNITDLEIEREVADRLAREGMAEIGARVQAGTAFLMGDAPSLAVKRKAVEVASNVRGVRDIISELEIAAGEPVDDVTLANDVAEALSDDPEVDVMDLEVRSRDSSVLLLGRVADEDQLGTATTVAEAVPGVQRVENRMTVRRVSP